MKFLLIKSVFAFPFTGVRQSVTGCTEEIENICSFECQEACPIYLQVNLKSKYKILETPVFLNDSRNRYIFVSALAVRGDSLL